MSMAAPNARPRLVVGSSKRIAPERRTQRVAVRLPRHCRLACARAKRTTRALALPTTPGRDEGDGADDRAVGQRLKGTRVRRVISGGTSKASSERRVRPGLMRGLVPSGKPQARSVALAT